MAAAEGLGPAALPIAARGHNVHFSGEIMKRQESGNGPQAQADGHEEEAVNLAARFTRRTTSWRPRGHLAGISGKMAAPRPGTM